MAEDDISREAILERREAREDTLREDLALAAWNEIAELLHHMHEQQRVMIERLSAIEQAMRAAKGGADG